MKKLVCLTLLAFFGFTAGAQSLKIVDTEFSQKAIIGQDIRTIIKIQNTSTEPVYFRIEVIKSQIGSSQKTFLCINNECETGNIVQKQARISDKVNKIMPGAISESITAVLETGLVQGISSVSYLISNVNQANDNLLAEFQYEVTEPPKEGLLYSSKNVDLSDVYPNPVKETAIFDYKIKNDTQEAKIIIHNVLGSIAGEYKLNPYEQQLKVSVEDFNPGVYFYSLYINNEGVATKKLVVRK